MKLHFLTTSLFLLSSTSIWAESTPQCLSGQSGQSNMIMQLERAESISPVTAAILKKYPNKSQATTAAVTKCLDCENNPLVAKTQPLTDAAKKAQGILPAPQLLFKEACLNISNSFDADTEQVTCPDGKRSKSRDICMNSAILHYINSAISSFYSCMQSENLAPVSPEVLFQMYSMETGFRPQYAYNGGVGMGQLVGVRIEDNYQAWRGLPFLKKVADSKNSECEAAKIIAAKDLKKRPSLNQRCDFIQLGEGMERNILHSLVSLNTNWKNDIAPLLNPYLEKHKGHPALEDIKSLVTITAYGYGGRAAARTAARRLSVLPPDIFRSKMQEPLYGVRKQKDGKTESVVNYLKYTNGLARRQNKIAAELQEPIRSQFAKDKTRACINGVN